MESARGEHIVDCGLVFRDAGKRVTYAVAIPQQVETAPQARHHPKTEHIDLEHFQDIQIVLVPFDHFPLFHRGVLDGNDFVEVSLGYDEAADMLGKMPGEFQQIVGQRKSLIQTRVERIEASTKRLLFRNALHRPAPYR